MNYRHELNGKSTIKAFFCCGLLLAMSALMACSVPRAAAPATVQLSPTPLPTDTATPAVATPAAEDPSPVPATPTTDTEAKPEPTQEPTNAPTPTSAYVPPAGFKQYQDSVTGVTVTIPESWTVTGIIPGEWAILQSYSETKYVGGEPFQPGDTKCDLVIRPPDVDITSHMEQLGSDPSVTVLSESEVDLDSGWTGIRAEIESMGRSVSLYAEIRERLVMLTCWGELAPFDEIAVTLGASE